MGLPLLLAVGLVGPLSTRVWLSLLAVVGGVRGLAVSLAVSSRCQMCTSASVSLEDGGPRVTLRLVRSVADMTDRAVTSRK